MSGASAPVSAAPSAPIAASNAVGPQPETATQPGPSQSFTEVLSAQRAESEHGEGARRDAEAKRGPSHGAKEVQDDGGHPSSPSSGQLPAAAGSPAAAPVSQVAASVATAAAAAVVATAPEAAAATGPPDSSAPGTEGDPTVLEAAFDAGTAQPAPLSPQAAATTSAGTDPSDLGATTPTDADPSDDATAAASAGAEPVPLTGPEDRADDGTGLAGSDAAPPTGSTATATSGLVAPKTRLPTLTSAVAAHGGATTEAAPLHAAPAPAEAAPALRSIATTAPVPHLLNEGPLAPPDASRGLASVVRTGASAAPSGPSVAAQAASALDVDGLSGSISRPLSDGNGTYTVTVALHPSELGHVQAVMSLDGNDLSVSLSAQTQTGHDALANAADALKNQLARGGVNVNVTLRDPGSQGGGEERYRPSTSAGHGPFITESTATESLLPSGLVAGQIHLVL
jgi:hypothetical protein